MTLEVKNLREQYLQTLTNKTEIVLRERHYLKFG